MKTLDTYSWFSIKLKSNRFEKHKKKIENSTKELCAYWLDLKTKMHMPPDKSPYQNLRHLIRMSRAQICRQSDQTGRRFQARTQNDHNDISQLLVIIMIQNIDVTPCANCRPIVNGIDSDSRPLDDSTARRSDIWQTVRILKYIICFVIIINETRAT